MKIYKVERTDPVGYDEYDSMVVVAGGEYEALKLAQDYGGESLLTDRPYFRHDNTTVIEVALSHPGVVVAGFNAG